MDCLSKLDGTNLYEISLIILVSSSLLLICHFNNPLIVNKLVLFFETHESILTDGMDGMDGWMDGWDGWDGMDGMGWIGWDGRSTFFY